MARAIFNKSFLGLILFIFLFGQVYSVEARDLNQSKSLSKDNNVAFSNRSNIFFSEIQSTEISLDGPYDSFNLVFGLPAEWQVGTRPGDLHLFFGVSFNSSVQNSDGVPISSGGTLTLLFNKVIIGVINLNQVGEMQTSFELPFAALQPSRSDGRMELTMVLDSGQSCFVDQQMRVVVHLSSEFNFPHDDVLPDTNLVNFPFPLFQDSIIPDTALIVIPDQPSESELTSYLTLSAGLSNLTGGLLTLDVVQASRLTLEQKTLNHLILIGKASSLPVISELSLPLPVINGGYPLNAGESEDVGIIEMVNSPWSLPSVVLVISGNTDTGVLKAARTISTGVLRTGTFKNLAIVDQVQNEPVPVANPENITLTDLGYDNQLFNRKGTSSTSFRFNIPPGMTVASDAYFEVVYGNSALINFDRSGLTIILNGKPIGSIKLTEITAQNSTNRARINIPESAILTGSNRLDISVTLVAIDTCTSPDVRALWVNIWPESNLHIPLTQAVVSPSSAKNLTDYPSPYIYDTNLSDTAFVLPRNDLDSWRMAMQVAGNLGDRANASLVSLKAFYADEVPESERANYNFIVIGTPSKLPFIVEINSLLPAPFSGDIAAESNLQVSFVIPPDSPVGYVQLLSSPWNSEKTILAALGNTSQGVVWATSTLLDSNLNSSLSGNFAIVKDQQVVTADTRLGSPPSDLINSPNDPPGVVVVPPTISVSTNNPPERRSSWILPALIVTFTLLFLTIAWTIYSGLVRNRLLNNPEKDKQNLIGHKSGSSLGSSRASLIKRFTSFFRRQKK